MGGGVCLDNLKMTDLNRPAGRQNVDAASMNARNYE